jgi:hypothetical protein
MRATELLLNMGQSLWLTDACPDVAALSPAYLREPDAPAGRIAHLCTATIGARLDQFDRGHLGEVAATREPSRDGPAGCDRFLGKW